MENPIIHLSILENLPSGVDPLQKRQQWEQFFKNAGVTVSSSAAENAYQLSLGDVAELRDQQGRVLRTDFIGNHLDYQRKHRGKSELIAKALGVGKGTKKILDLTMGLGIDAVFFTQLGCQVIAIERNPILYALLSESLERSQLPIDLVFADAVEFLKNEIGKLQVDAIYFDPMYPEKKKTALPRLEMQIFRELIGADQDADLVLSEALKWPVSRVVVKRPIKAEALPGKVTHSFEGKTVRYDLYRGNL